jgi:Xaa-Pro dipeptidase
MGSAQPDLTRLRSYRLARLQAELAKLDVTGALLADPINIRYATDIRNMQVWSLHSLVRYAFVPTQGKSIAFEYPGSEHLAAGLETVSEVRPALPRFSAGQHRDARGEADAQAREWAREIADLAERTGGWRIAIDGHIDHYSALALADAGLSLVPARLALSRAQVIKSIDEVACIEAAIAATETGMEKMRAALVSGISENQLWAILNGTNIALGGEYSDTRLLSSGTRTNPWYQEASNRLVNSGEVVSFDTDMIGPFGYDADISRSFLCPPGRPTDRQLRLYGVAWDQLHHNLELIRPGASFREMSEKAFRLPDEFRAQQMAMTWHGVGLCGQWPTIVGPGHYKPDAHLDGIIEPNMVLCCESYVGAIGQAEGVKLEQQILVTGRGYRLLSSFPFEDTLLRG